MQRSSRFPSAPLVSAIALGALVLTSCAASGGASTSARAANGATAIAVTLQEWSVSPDTGTAPAGTVTFNVTNEGPEDVHEFVVLATDLEPSGLPTDEHGAVAEDGEGIRVVDEIEDIPVGAHRELSVELGAGNYVLLCNIYSEDEDEAHYQLGMRAQFEVTN